MPVAMELSMIVEITSFTPRDTLSSAGDRGPQRADDDGDARMKLDVQRRREASPRHRRRPTALRPSRYWPSTPMLNSPILKPMATASAET